MPVCKITDMNGNLLYRRYDWNKITNVTNERNYYAPAVFTELTGEDGAFKALEGSLYTSNAANPISYSVNSNGAQLQMLTKEYSLGETARVNSAKVTLTTASSADKLFPKRDAGTTSTVKRAFSGGSMLEVRGGLILTAVILDGAKDSRTAETDGGIAAVSSGGSLTVTNGATLQNSRTTARGGAVYAAAGSAVTVSGGTVNGNVSDGDGAGIYLAQGGKLYLSGNPSFGGTSLNGGSHRSGTLMTKTNGGSYYPSARQDIFIEGYSEEPVESLVITGEIDSGNGTIFVWAGESAHYKTLTQFAKLAAGVTVSEKTCTAFRNARPDDEAENGTDGYLFGEPAEDGNINWSGIKGSRKVILRKVDGNSFASLTGAQFELWKGGKQYETGSFESKANGVFYVGTLPYGTYFLKETAAPGANYSGNKDKWYCLLVNSDGAWASETGYADQNAAKTDAEEVWKSQAGTA